MFLLCTEVFDMSIVPSILQATLALLYSVVNCFCRLGDARGHFGDIRKIC